MPKPINPMGHFCTMEKLDVRALMVMNFKLKLSNIYSLHVSMGVWLSCGVLWPFSLANDASFQISSSSAAGSVQISLM